MGAEGAKRTRANLSGKRTKLILPGEELFLVVMIISGAIMTSSLVWDISDTFNGPMMIPNLIGVVALAPLVTKITKNYVNRKIKGLDEEESLSYDPAVSAEVQNNLD